MSKVLFIDPTTPHPYTLEDLPKGRMGGTEATCLRVVRELSKRHEVTLLQRGKDALDVTLDIDPNVVITLRDARMYREAIQLYPNAVHYLWLHDVVSGDYAKHMEECLADGKVHKIIAVSNWHKNQVFNALPRLTLAGALNIQVIYNPIEDYCVRTNIPYDPKYLIYFSSPHKGLDDVIEIFKHLRTLDSGFRLFVANPGYYADKQDLPEGVISLTYNNLSHEQLMGYVATSLCMFYPQITFEETFGLVYAESNAVGTPVIAHNLGAAPEVLDNNHQLMDCRNVDKVISTVLDWSKGGRPTVSGNKMFRMSEVIKVWNKLIQFGGVG